MSRASIVMPEPHILAGALLAIMFFVVGSCGHGVPSFRHDWIWPLSGDSMRNFLSRSWSGWDQNGYGTAIAYTESFAIATAIVAMCTVFGPYIGFIVCMVLLGIYLAAAALVFLRACGAPSWIVTLGIPCFVLNPWVYQKLVAGHEYMLVAYASFTIVLALVLARSMPLWIVFVAELLVVQQLQFALLISPFIIVASIRARDVRIALLFAVLMAPGIVGLLSDRLSLDRIAFRTDWENIQSVPMLEAVRFLGYYAGYWPTEKLGTANALLYLLPFTCAGIAIWERRRASLLALLLGLLLIAVVGWGRSPAAGAFLFIVQHVRSAAVFRELYDLVGLLALVFLFIASRARATWVPMVGLALMVAICAATWTFMQPSRLWVDARTVQVRSFSAPSNTRFALFPAFQPLRYAHDGSGMDADAFVRSWNITPLNTYDLSYPESAALLDCERTGAVRQLERLSVSRLISRDKEEEVSSVNWTSGSSANKCIARGVRHVRASSEAALIRDASVNWSVPAIGNDDISFVDATPRTDFHPQPQPGWVDLDTYSLAYLPFLQPLGGFGTNGKAVSYTVGTARAMLVAVLGELRAHPGGRRLSIDPRYRWVDVRGADQIICSGRCAIAAVTFQMPQPVRAAASSVERPLELRQLLPWIAIINTGLRERGEKILKYNVRYDPSWLAVADGGILPHIRLDGITNAWMLPQGYSSLTVVVFDAVAFAQWSLEWFALALFVIFIWKSKGIDVRI